MLRSAIALAAAALVLPFVASAETDFSGTWKMDFSRSESAHQAVPIEPTTLVITQTSREVSIETKSGSSNEKLTFKLDGSESVIADSSTSPIKVKAHRDGPKLVMETVRAIKGSTVTTTDVLSLDATGKELTLNRSLTVQHGYQFEGANNTGTGKDVFVKAKEPSNK